MADMRICFLDPKAPLVFRTGRPFGSTEGGESLDFPLPSTLAGALRRAAAKDLDAAEVARVGKLACAGPLLASREPWSGEIHALFHAPADALVVRNRNPRATNSPFSVQRCRPEPLTGDEGLDLDPRLWPVLPPDTPEDPVADFPFWTRGAMERWLLAEPAEQGWAEEVGRHPPPQTRTHTAIDPERRAAKDEALFQSSGLDFARRFTRSDPQPHCQEFGLLAGVDADLHDDVFRLGGEGRLVTARRAADAWPGCPESLHEPLDTQRCLRLVLATPAWFPTGYLPDWLHATTLHGRPPGLPDLELRLRAVACPRWQPWSGWDLAGNRPKALRRLVPAGSVYWFEVLAGRPKAEQLWLQSICRDEAARRDGFGLCLPGVWTPPSP